MSSHYDTTILADGPVAYWPLNETVGATAADLTGNGHYGTYVGGCSQGATGIGDGETAVSFDGSTGHVTIPTTPEAGVGPWSAEAWFQTRNAGSQAGALLSSGAVYQPQIGTGMFAALAGGSGIQAGRETVATVTDGSWHYGAITWTGGGAAPDFYVDGALRTSATASATGAPIVTPSAPLLVGATPYFGGQIAKVAVYNTALTASQVANHYAAVSTPSSSGTATITVSVDGTSVSTMLTIVGGSTLPSPPGPVSPPVIS